MDTNKENPQAPAEAPANEQAKAKSAEAKPAGKEAPAAPAAKIEKGTNCPVCNKSIKKKWYYRNGKYFCCKGCFQQDKKKAQGANAEAKPAA
jgi:hypothetical protein